MTVPKFTDGSEDPGISVPAPKIDDSEEEYSYTYNIKKQKDSDIKEENGKDLIAMARRWRNRRRMAWMSLLCMFVLTYFIIFTDIVPIARLTVLKEVITWFYFACISVVGAYMGFTTWASRR
jgi:hypothetical protein